MEIALILSAFGLGVASGFHCVGMCGPIALSMGLTRQQALNYHLQNITYNLGRVFTYAILGALLGIIGAGFQFAGLQKYLTIGVGILLVLMAILSFGKSDFSSKIPFLSNFLRSVKNNLGKLLRKADLKSRFFTGILNGFLPCGMVYMALTASLASGGIWQGALFMALFGLGTIPFMFAVVLAGNLLSTTLRLKLLKVIPVVMLLLGSLFIVRGMELGIPYVSPKKEALQISEHGNGGMHHHSNEKAPSCH